jgi:hypothetical protein
MQLFFSVLSVLYVAALFLLAGSPVTKGLASYNPYSLLHIPLYGIMSLLFFFSVTPVKCRQVPRGGVSLRRPRINLIRQCLVVGLIALVIAVADEYRQSFISTRFASAGDVLLDLVGIVLSMVLTLRFFKTKAFVTADAPDDRG